MSAPVKLTAAQRRALAVLFRGKSLGSLVRTSKDSCGARDWSLRINGRVAVALERLGLAKHRCVLIDGREVRGADLARLLGHWSTKYEITKAGERAHAEAIMSETPAGRAALAASKDGAK